MITPYTTIITDEALRRDINVKIVDADAGYFLLDYAVDLLCAGNLSVN